QLMKISAILRPFVFILKNAQLRGCAVTVKKAVVYILTRPGLRKRMEKKAVPVKFYPGLPGNVIAAGMLVIIIFWNWSTLPEKKNHLPIPVQRIALRLGLDQRWSMFAPYPRTADGWFVMPGQLRDGTTVDIRTGKPVNWEKPKNYAASIPSDRWRKYYENYAYGNDFNDFRMDYGKYLCREWNSSHPYQKQLMTYKIEMKREDELPNYKTSKPRDVHFWTHYCFDEVAPPDIIKK
ncbi:MAG: hypothetical protein KC649_07525, partial [Candidatus Omnitrophica bacterium]|nr:hypothetical protein [Candidatus Omnitrophota bacterium]